MATVTLEGTLIQEGKTEWLIDFGDKGLGVGTWIAINSFEVTNEDGDDLTIEIQESTALEKGLT